MLWTALSAVSQAVRLVPSLGLGDGFGVCDGDSDGVGDGDGVGVAVGVFVGSVGGVLAVGVGLGDGVRFVAGTIWYEVDDEEEYDDCVVS